MQRSFFSLLVCCTILFIACGSTEEQSVRDKAATTVRETVAQPKAENIITYTIRDTEIAKGETVCMPVNTKKLKVLI